MRNCRILKEDGGLRIPIWVTWHPTRFQGHLKTVQAGLNEIALTKRCRKLHSERQSKFHRA